MAIYSVWLDNISDFKKGRNPVRNRSKWREEVETPAVMSKESSYSGTCTKENLTNVFLRYLNLTKAKKTLNSFGKRDVGGEDSV